MSIETGNILSNFRTRTIPNIIVESDITDEIQTVSEYPEFAGIYGFRLNEVPRTDLQGITIVRRNTDNQIFTWTNSDTPATNQYGFDYNNPLPNVYLPSSESGISFTIAYKGTGGAYSSKNIISLSALSGNIEERLINVIRTNELNYSLVNQNIFTYNKILTINNLTITGTCTVRTNNPNSIGILEILGDLTLSNFAILKTIRVILIVHGNILCPIGTAQIVGQDGFNGGNIFITAATRGTGGGGAGTGQNGFIGSGVFPYYGGNGGYSLIDQFTQTNSAGGSSNPTSPVNGSFGGGGGGGINDQNGATGSMGGGSGGAGGGDNASLSYLAGSVSNSSIFHGTGGRGGNGLVSISAAGVGGGSGGSSIAILCLGDITSNLTLKSGKNGLNGTVGNLTGATNPYSGNIILYSRYTNGDIPATLDVSSVGLGNAGTLYREQIGVSAKMGTGLINNILSELSLYDSTLQYGLGTKQSGDV